MQISEITCRVMATGELFELLTEQLDSEGDAGQGIDDEKGRLGCRQRSCGKGRFEKRRSEDAADHHRVHRPMEEETTPALVGENFGRRFHECRVDGPHQSGGRTEEGGSAGRRSPSAGDQQDHDHRTATAQRHHPAGRCGMAVALAGIGRHQKADEPGTQKAGRAPGAGGDPVAEPQPPQGKGEDELGDQNRLHGGQLSEIEGQGGEDEGSAHAHHPQEPHGLAHQKSSGLPRRSLLIRSRHIGQSLEHRCQRLAERAQQREQDAHGNGVSVTSAMWTIRDQRWPRWQGLTRSAVRWS